MNHCGIKGEVEKRLPFHISRDPLVFEKCIYCRVIHGYEPGKDQCYRHQQHLDLIEKEKESDLRMSDFDEKPPEKWSRAVGSKLKLEDKTISTDEDMSNLISETRAAKEVGAGKSTPVPSSIQLPECEKELIKEDEKELKKKLKKKEKKKRQKAKKKELESKPSTEKNDESSEESEEDFKDDNSEDLIRNSAFAAGTKKGGNLASIPVQAKSAPQPVAPKINQPKQQEKGERNGLSTEQETLDKYAVAYDEEESVRRAKEGAVWTKKAVTYEDEGKPVAARTMYTEALMSFNKAIKLWPFDCRYYANRSFVYTQLGDYLSAIRDADFAISRDPDFIKGYFRKGKALLRLKKYDEADSCFLKILELDPDCEEAEEEIRGIKFLRLKDMGFTDEDINKALESSHNVFEDALQMLINKPQSTQAVRVPSPQKPPSPPLVKPAVTRPVFAPVVETKAVEIIPAAGSMIVVKDNLAVDPYQDPRNPLMSKSIWVGNLNDITDKCEKKIRTLFAPFGNIHNVTIKPESRCAFINYVDHKSAGNAMKALQGQKFGINNLLIRYPANNNAATTQNKPNLVLAKGAVVIGNKPAAARPAVENKNPERVGTVECRNWRAGNCAFGNNCWYKHVPEHKGVDKV